MLRETHAECLEELQWPLCVYDVQIQTASDNHYRFILGFNFLTQYANFVITVSHVVFYLFD